jgi:hypothetical protein
MNNQTSLARSTLTLEDLDWDYITNILENYQKKTGDQRLADIIDFIGNHIEPLDD